MADIIAYTRQPLVENCEYLIKREINEGSDVSVRVHDEVRPETIIASYWHRSGFRTFNIAEMFKVTPEKAAPLIKKTVGVRVYPGDILASKQELFGLKEKLFKSPLAGILNNYDEKSARLTIQYLPKEVKIVAGVFGQVIGIEANSLISIQTYADIIKGMISFGLDREGSLVEVGYPDIPLQTDQLNNKLTGKIIFGGTRVSLDFIYKALGLGVKGIISGSMDYKDYLYLQGSRGKYEDVGISLLITEGYNNTPIYPKTYQKLKQSVQKHVLFNAESGTIVLPILYSPLENSAQKIDQKREQYTLLKVDDEVHVINGTNEGEYGTVSELNENGVVKMHSKNGIIEIDHLNLEKII